MCTRRCVLHWLRPRLLFAIAVSIFQISAPKQEQRPKKSLELGRNVNGND